MTEPANKRRVDRPVRAIVTGAARGTGALFANHLAERGVELLLVDRDEVALARIGRDTGAAILRCDILDEQCVSDMFAVAEQWLGAIDLLINAAGTGYVRTLGVMRSSREFSRQARPSLAFVVNLAAAPDTAEGPFPYAGSEAAFSRLAEGLARAIEGPQLRVLTLDRIDQPGPVADLVDQLLREIDAAGERHREGPSQAAL